MHPISEYFNRLNVFAALALSQDGTRLAYQSSVTGSPQIWLGTVPAQDGLVSYPKPLTNGKEEQPHVMPIPNLQWVGNDRLLCLMDRHGDEQTYISIQDFKKGTTSNIPAEAGARDFLGFTSKDHQTHFFTSNRGNPASQGLFSYDFKTEKVEKWHQHEEESSYWLGDKVYQGRRVFGRSRSNSANSLHLIHLKTKEVTDLFTLPGTLIEPIQFLPNGKMACVTNYSRQFQSLAFYDLKTKKFEFVGPDKWDVEFAKLSSNKKLLLLSRNVAGRSQLEMYSWPKLKKIKISVPTQGVIESLSFAENGKFAVFSFQSPVQPRDFYRLNLKTKKAQQLTDNWTSKIPRRDFTMPKPVSFDSQGQKIHSWLFLPKGAKKNKSLPVIIWPHGGPQAQERLQFRPIFQYFVGRGFAVWAPNHTGSTGFGQDFTKKIFGQWGTADLPDMENGIEWLKKSGWINPARIAIMGGSYGGYMTLRTLTRISKTFKAGVDIFGVSNLFTFVKSVPPDWIPFMDESVGNPERDEAKLREQSPIFSLDRIDCPLLVIQGAKDPRVVKAESDQVVETLQKQGKKVDYLVFEDEGHGFFKLENELKAYKTAAAFLEKYI